MGSAGSGWQPKLAQPFRADYEDLKFEAAVRYRLLSDPLFTYCCHCLNCRRQTGSAFVINLLIEADRMVLLAGVPEPVDVPRDDGSNQRIFRCPTCQVPDVHIFTRSKLPWITLPDSAPAFEVYYDSKVVCGRQPRAAHGDHAVGELRRLSPGTTCLHKLARATN